MLLAHPAKPGGGRWGFLWKRDGLGCRPEGISARKGLAQVRVVSLPRFSLQPLSPAPPKDTRLSVLTAPPQQHSLPKTILCSSLSPARAAHSHRPGTEENTPREGAEGTVSLSRLHTPTPHTTSGVSPTLPQSPVLPPPIPAGGTAGGTEPSLDARVILGGHPGMLPTHPALPLRKGMEREEAAPRSVSGVPRARTRSLRYVYKNMYIFLLYLYFFPSSSSSSFHKETDIFGQSPAETSVIPRVALQKGGSSCSFRAFNPLLPGDGRDGREATGTG